MSEHCSLRFEIDCLEEDLQAIRDEVPIAHLPFEGLDTKLNGLHAGDLVVVSAPPGAGKTAFVLQIADSVATQERRAIYANLEEYRWKLVRRSLARMSNGLVSVGDVGRASDRDLSDSLERYRSQVAPNIAIVPTVRSTDHIEQLLAEADKKYSQGGSVVVIDYVQLLSPSSGSARSDDSRISMKNVVNELKALATKYKVCIIAVSAVTRTSYGSEKARVNLSSLSETGTLEYASDVILALSAATKQKASKCGNNDGRTVEVEILKNRHGDLGSCPFRLDAAFAMFVEDGDEYA